MTNYVCYWEQGSNRSEKDYPVGWWVSKEIRIVVGYLIALINSETVLIKLTLDLDRAKD